MSIDADFKPAQRRRFIPVKAPLSGVVRVSKTGQCICLRIAGDVAAELGWTDDTRLRLLVGSGRMKGMVRLEPTQDENEGYAFKNLPGRAKTIVFAGYAISAREAPVAIFSAEPQIDGQTLTLNLSNLMENDYAQ